MSGTVNIVRRDVVDGIRWVHAGRAGPSDGCIKTDGLRIARLASTAISQSCPLFLSQKQVHSNLMWALGYNIVAIPLAAGAFLPGWGLSLSPALAGAIMSCSSIAVVTNSLLLRRTLERDIYKG